MVCATPMIYAQADGIVSHDSSDVAMRLNGAAKGKVIDSGSCGKNVNYELYDDYTLRIFGNGPMDDFYHSDEGATTSPWGKDIYEKIKYVVIEDGVTRIGDASFYWCSSLVDVKIANSVESIGLEAFQQCSALTEITIPNSVKSMDRMLFFRCSALTKINIPNSVTFIDYLAFEQCSSLVEVNLSNNLETLSSGLFGYCSSLAHIKIPNSVTCIKDFAFDHCSSLAKIDIPNSVTSIGEAAFQYCDKLKHVKIGENVTEIGGMAFPQNNDEDLVIEVTSETPANLHSVDAFGYLCTIYVPENALEAYRNAKWWNDHADQILPKEQTTGISSIEREQSEKETSIYDLQGHRVKEMQPSGIYIVNGKKVYSR